MSRSYNRNNTKNRGTIKHNFRGISCYRKYVQSVLFYIEISHVSYNSKTQKSGLLDCIVIYKKSRHTFRGVWHRFEGDD